MGRNLLKVILPRRKPGLFGKRQKNPLLFWALRHVSNSPGLGLV
jgi:hypothetical protein